MYDSCTVRDEELIHVMKINFTKIIRLILTVSYYITYRTKTETGRGHRI